jgi:hypothetical protein
MRRCGASRRPGTFAVGAADRRSGHVGDVQSRGRSRAARLEELHWTRTNVLILDREVADLLGPRARDPGHRGLLDLVDARPLHAFVAKSNVASIRMLEKSGFVKVGEHAGDDGIEELLLELRA